MISFIHDITTIVVSLVSFCVTAGGALLAAAAFLCFCSWVLWLAGERMWRRARRLYRLKDLLDGLRDMQARGHVYPPPVEGDQ